MAHGFMSHDEYRSTNVVRTLGFKPVCAVNRGPVHALMTAISGQAPSGKDQ